MPCNAVAVLPFFCEPGKNEIFFEYLIFCYVRKIPDIVRLDLSYRTARWSALHRGCFGKPVPCTRRRPVLPRVHQPYLIPNPTHNYACRPIPTKPRQISTRENSSQKTGAPSPGPHGCRSPQTKKNSAPSRKNPASTAYDPPEKTSSCTSAKPGGTPPAAPRTSSHASAGELMPWNDPTPAAPSLWAWQDAEGFEYECSATPLDASQSGRRGMESFLLYRYRQECGESTLCNFGRFHPRYRKSTNRKENKRGGKLEENHQDNPAGGPSAYHH